MLYKFSTKRLFAGNQQTADMRVWARTCVRAVVSVCVSFCVCVCDLFVVNVDMQIVCLQEPEFSWTPETIGVVDSSFFWGYIITQIPGGYLASRLPANRLVKGKGGEGVHHHPDPGRIPRL